MFKKFIAFFLILSLQVQAQSTSTGVDTIIIGKPGSTAPVKIKSKDGGYLKKEVGGPWTYSPDGLLEKKLGSGSGSGGSSGINLITNDSLEDGVGSPWTSSGGTFTQQTYAVSSEGDTKFGQFIATTSGQYVEQIVSVPSNFSVGCQADFKKVNIATAGLFKVQALDVSNNVLAEQTIGVSAWIKVPTISFLCPASGTNNLKLRLISLAAGTIQFDRGYIGSNQNIVTGGNIVDVESATYTGFTSRSGQLIKFATKDTTRSNNAKIIQDDNSGSFTRYNILKAASVTAIYAGQYGAARSESVVVHYNSSGTVVKAASGFYTDASSTGGANLATLTSYALPGDYFVAQESAVNPNNASTTTTFSITAISSYTGEAAISNEQSSWFIDANIGGANPSLGVSAVSSYAEIALNGLDLVVNSNKGSSAAEIACVSGNASTGSTCTGIINESLGVSFIPPSAGQYEACFAFTHDAAAATNSSIKSTFQVVETPNNAVTILQEGGQRTMSGVVSGVGGISYVQQSNNICGTFSFADVSKKTLRLVYEQTVTGSGATSAILSDRNAADGQRDIKITVRPILSAYNRPTLIGDQVTTPNIANPKFFSFQINADNSISKNFGGLGNACLWTSNVVACTFVSGKITAPPNCTLGSTSAEYGFISSPTASGFSIYAQNSSGGGATPATFISVNCHGY